MNYFQKVFKKFSICFEITEINRTLALRKRLKITTMSLNNEFRVVFQPKDLVAHNGKRRFAIGAGSIAKYVGQANAETAIEKALNSTGDRFTIKFRKHGRIDFYVK